MLTNFQAVIIGSGFIFVLTVILCWIFNFPLCTIFGMLWIIIYFISYPGGSCLTEYIMNLDKYIDLQFFISVTDNFHYMVTRTLSKILDFKENTGATRRRSSHKVKLNKYRNYDPHTELRKLVSLIHRDFIASWYGELSSCDIWSNDCLSLLHELSKKLFDRSTKVNMNEFATDVIHLYQEHIHDMQEAQQLYDRQPKFKKKGSGTEVKKIKSLEDAFSKLGKYHVAMEKSEVAVQYLRSVCEMVLILSCPPQLCQCKQMFELVVDAITCSVLSDVINMLSEPSWIHEFVTNILSEEAATEEKSSFDQVKDGYLEENDVNSSHKILNSDTDMNYLWKHDLGISEREEQQFVGQGRLKEESKPLLASQENFTKQASSSVLDPNEIQEFESSHLSSTDDVQREKIDRTINIHIHENAGKHQKDIVGGSMLRSCSDSDLSSTLALSSALASHKQMLKLSVKKPVQVSRSLFHLDSIQDGTGVSHHTGDSSSMFYTETDHTEPIQDTLSHNSDSLAEQLNRPLFSLDEENDRISLASNTSGNTDELTINPSNFEIAATSISQVPEPTSSEDGATSPECLFLEIKVNKTETCLEPRGNARYILYMIQYEAWHYNCDEEVWQSREDTVGRRYREFVTLHERLEEHPLYKKCIKGIRGPKKWTMIPFGSMDQKVVESRRQGLEEYLQKLISRKEICNSMAMREFLAYEGDARIAFVRQVSERLDKVIVKGVASVFNKLTNVLPSAYPGSVAQLPSQPTQKPRRAVDVSNWVDPHAFLVHYETADFVQEWTHSAEDLLQEHAEVTEQSLAADEDTEILRSSPEFHDALDFSLGNALPRTAGDGCEDSQAKERAEFDADIKVAAAVLNLAVKLYGDKRVWLTQHKTITLVKVLAGKLLERHFEQELGVLATAGFCGYCLSQLRDRVWPGGELAGRDHTVLSEQAQQELQQQCRQAVFQFMPVVLVKVVGEENINICINQIMNSVSHKMINRNFIFRLVDLLVETLFPEIDLAEIQRQLITF